ncbi:Hypothetical protein NTJ_01006 [Nesidiocoris tenuis]|uniref:Uncharacterized protein n=1 Tax=Nesidiocoris tenuis TaxID=355587 RepID=A0ABN7ABJ1_9HEMI|nr:Hypothetical protein NTJ_01006 [Nesidiocoris tenuis]
MKPQSTRRTRSWRETAQSRGLPVTAYTNETLPTPLHPDRNPSSLSAGPSASVPLSPTRRPISSIRVPVRPCPSPPSIEPPCSAFPRFDPAPPACGDELVNIKIPKRPCQEHGDLMLCSPFQCVVRSSLYSIIRSHTGSSYLVAALVDITSTR